MITKKHLSRRTLLRGIGVSLGLPFLDSMFPALAGPTNVRIARSAARFPVNRLCDSLNADILRPPAAGRILPP